MANLALFVDPGNPIMQINGKLSIKSVLTQAYSWKSANTLSNEIIP